MERKKHLSFKNNFSLIRKGETRYPLKAYLIACEGICTEPNYINGLVRYEKANRRIADGTVVKIAPHQHSDPYGVLEDLLRTPNKSSYDECWIVIDRDETELKGKGFGGHSEENFNKVLDESKKNGVEVACSNPCFELWIVLHFEFRDTACTREAIQKKALEKVNSILPKEKQLKKVDELKAIENLYDLLRDKVIIAIRNAEKLKLNESNKSNPSSGMYKLLNSLLQQEFIYPINHGY